MTVTAVTAGSTVCAMTVVAAIASAGRVVMAADTVTQYHGTLVQGARKIRRLRFEGAEEILISGSGNGAIVQTIPQRLKTFTTPKPHDGDASWNEWAEIAACRVTDFLVDTVPPLTTTSEGGGTVVDGSFLLGAAGRLWYLFTNQSVPVVDGIAALGSGSDLALGVLAAAPSLASMPHPPETLAVLAVRIACRFDPHCQIKDIPQVETLG